MNSATSLTNHLIQAHNYAYDAFSNARHRLRELTGYTYSQIMNTPRTAGESPQLARAYGVFDATLIMEHEAEHALLYAHMNRFIVAGDEEELAKTARHISQHTVHGQHLRAQIRLRNAPVTPVTDADLIAQRAHADAHEYAMYLPARSHKSLPERTVYGPGINGRKRASDAALISGGKLQERLVQDWTTIPII